MGFKSIIIFLLLFSFGCKFQQSQNGKIPNETPTNMEDTEPTIKIKTIPIVAHEGFGNAAKNYSEFCASCHGIKMEAFTDQIRKWKHGKSVPEIKKSIKDGIVKDGMPAFQETFSPEEIEDLAKYIRSGIETWDAYSFKDVPSQSTTFETSAGTIQLESVFDKAESPWGMAFLPNGKMLISDKTGDLYLKSGNEIAKLANVPKVNSSGQGGLMDIEIHPNFSENGWIYLSFSKVDPTDSDKTNTAVIRSKINGTSLESIEEIFVALPFTDKAHHFGSRMEFDKDGYLYLTVGDRGNRDNNPQSLDNHCGKVHRIQDDGRIPKDNPFVKIEGAVPSIYSYGHRNPQGLVIDKSTGTIWETEHGPRGGDELNIIKKGINYGWPKVSFGINYNGTTFTDKVRAPEFKGPENFWVPSIAPCGTTMITSDKYGDWKGDLLIGSLRFKYLSKISLKDDVILGEEHLFPNIGRVRNVEMSPDGFIYLAVEKPGNIYKVVLKEN